MTENSTPKQFTPPTADPWKGFRGVMAGTLILEVIVVALDIGRRRRRRIVCASTQSAAKSSIDSIDRERSTFATR